MCAPAIQRPLGEGTARLTGVPKGPMAAVACRRASRRTSTPAGTSTPRNRLTCRQEKQSDEIREMCRENVQGVRKVLSVGLGTLGEQPKEQEQCCKSALGRLTGSMHQWGEGSPSPEHSRRWKTLDRGVEGVGTSRTYT